MRLAGFWMSMYFCAIVASFLAYGILHLDGVAGKAGWRSVTSLQCDGSIIYMMLGGCSS